MRALIRTIPSRVIRRSATVTVGRLTDNQSASRALRTTSPLTYDAYACNRATGSFILIDEASNQTVAAGMLLN